MRGRAAFTRMPASRRRRLRGSRHPYRGGNGRNGELVAAFRECSFWLGRPAEPQRDRVAEQLAPSSVWGPGSDACSSSSFAVMSARECDASIGTRSTTYSACVQRARFGENSYSA
jgi:hypothetical protein